MSLIVSGNKQARRLSIVLPDTLNERSAGVEVDVTAEVFINILKRLGK